MPNSVPTLPPAEEFQPRPLESNPFTEGHSKAAYERCLELEQRASAVHVPVGYPPTLVCSRVLGRALIEILNEDANGVAKFSAQINSATTDTALIELAKFFIDHLVRVFKAASTPTHAPSDHPSRPSFDQKTEFCAWIEEQSSLSHATAKQAALIRDGGHCIVLRHAYDYSWVASLRSEEQEMVVNMPGFVPIFTKCAHIIPESLYAEIENRACTGTVWALLGMFENINIDNLNRRGTHDLTNVFTLDSDLHILMDSMQLWFQAVPGRDDTYMVVFSNPLTKHAVRDNNRVITLTSSDPARLPLPSPCYLAVHAAICRIARMSGAAEYAENVLKDWEFTAVLAEDGSSAFLLTNILTTMSVR
ncbi:hypothetical protein Hypma_013054 [Hypsizygus marmoreus]|uniref:HNH nuclease domain-containing protein n=1 Tax=Hypsizygus marmoreus TaxID=39966 RepID=A0A369JKX6_HYPMA|nr:hypothetical protein Hypma_013054 [Hypsizygus marmoreus]